MQPKTKTTTATKKTQNNYLNETKKMVRIFSN